MKKRISSVAISLLLHTSVSFAATYPSIQAMLEANYSPSEDKENPWHKDDSESDMDNYSLCENVKLPFSSSDALIVMCPDTEIASSANEEIPTDIYWVRNSAGIVHVMAVAKNINGSFVGVMTVAPDKWAIEMSSGFNDQGYLQERHYLGLISASDFKTIAQWTAIMEDSNNNSSMNNTLGVDKNKPLSDGFYQLSVTSVTKEGKKTDQKNFSISYDAKSGSYKMPEVLNQTY